MVKQFIQTAEKRCKIGLIGWLRILLWLLHFLSLKQF